MQNYNQIDRVYAGFWARLGAFLIDSIIVFGLRLAARLALVFAFGLLGNGSFLDTAFLFQHSWKDALLYIVGVLYFVLCTYSGGATLGKKAMNLRVVSKDGQPLTFINVLFRETVGRFLSAFVLCIGYIMVGVTNEKTGLHDMLCDTRVIYAKKIPVYMNGDINKRYAHYNPEEKKDTQSAWEHEGASAEAATQAGQAAKAEAAELQVNIPQPTTSWETSTASQEEVPQTSQEETPLYTIPPQVQSAVPTRVIETPNSTINIYDRYMHVDPDKDRKK